MGVICVHTEEHNMDDIGFKLVALVKQDIKYKTDAASLDYKYTFTGSKKVCIKTIYWNRGRPSFECKDEPCPGTSYDKEDIWHLNVVKAPEPFSLRPVHGRWVLTLEYGDGELSSLWHHLKEIIESKVDNFGVIKMICPPKHNHYSPIEKPVFHVYTSGDKKKCVGKKLIEIVQRDLVYEHKPQHYNAPSQKERLFWNDGEPDSERISRKGITRNWRTGEVVS